MKEIYLISKNYNFLFFLIVSLALPFMSYQFLNQLFYEMSFYYLIFDGKKLLLSIFIHLFAFFVNI